MIPKIHIFSFFPPSNLGFIALFMTVVAFFALVTQSAQRRVHSACVMRADSAQLKGALRHRLRRVVLHTDTRQHASGVKQVLAYLMGSDRREVYRVRYLSNLRDLPAASIMQWSQPVRGGSGGGGASAGGGSTGPGADLKWVCGGSRSRGRYQCV